MSEQSDFEVGDRVQFYSKDETIFSGVILSFIAPVKELASDYWNRIKYSDQELKQMTEFAKVQLDDNSVNKVASRELMPEDSKLEREFRIQAKKAQEKIDEQLEEAHAAINKAVKLSEKYGIPFSASASLLNNTYTPVSLSEKWGNLGQDFIDEITDTYNEYGDSGWRHSAVC